MLDVECVLDQIFYNDKTCVGIVQPTMECDVRLPVAVLHEHSDACQFATSQPLPDISTCPTLSEVDAMAEILWACKMQEKPHDCIILRYVDRHILDLGVQYRNVKIVVTSDHAIYAVFQDKIPALVSYPNLLPFCLHHLWNEALWEREKRFIAYQRIRQWEHETKSKFGHNAKFDFSWNADTWQTFQDFKNPRVVEPIKVGSQCEVEPQCEAPKSSVYVPKSPVYVPKSPVYVPKSRGLDWLNANINIG